MQTVRVADFLAEKILVTRESARSLERRLAAAMAVRASSGPEPGEPSVAVDFEGVHGVSPSFMDELLSIFELSVKGTPADGPRRLLVTHPPTRLSLKFEAVARGHNMNVRLLPDGSWVLTATGSTAA